MSLKTWKKEFYPVPASKVSKENAVAHSLKKWQGLTKTNLKKHSVIHDVDHNKITDGKDFLGIEASSCALCCHHYESGPGCPTCPLSIARGVVECASCTPREETAPYSYWVFHSNPAPMIRWLKKALKAESKA